MKLTITIKDEVYNKIKQVYLDAGLTIEEEFPLFIANKVKQVIKGEALAIKRELINEEFLERMNLITKELGEVE